jgi:hypothetical protein
MGSPRRSLWSFRVRGGRTPFFLGVDCQRFTRWIVASKGRLSNRLFFVDGLILFRLPDGQVSQSIPGLSEPESPPPLLKPRDKINLFCSARWMFSWLIFRKTPAITGAAVSKSFGRFGNQLRQIATLAGLGIEMGFSKVYLANNDITPSGTKLSVMNVTVFAGPPVKRYGLGEFIQALWKSATCSQGILVGRFFELRAFPILEERVQQHRPSVLRRLGESVFEAHQFKPLPADHLVIHLRSGDVFDSSTPPNKFGQPPIGFYNFVIEQEKPSRVTIVSEDRLNPVFEKILELADTMSLPIQVQTASLREDLELLLSARTLCSSRGTFVEGVSSLSHNLQKIYLFGQDRFLRKDISVARVIDRKNEYWSAVCENNWRNTDEQRELMVVYGAENLELLAG